MKRDGPLKSETRHGRGWGLPHAANEAWCDPGTNAIEYQVGASEMPRKLTPASLETTTVGCELDYVDCSIVLSFSGIFNPLWPSPEPASSCDT